MIIRDYKPDDWTRISNIFNLAKPDEMRGSCNLDSILPLNEDHNLVQLFDNSKIIVAEVNEVVVGFAGFSNNLITWLFIDPTYYRQGIGEKLLETILSYLHDNASLYVAKYNKAAKNLYFSHGFEVVNEYRGTYNGYEAQALYLVLKSNV